MMRLAVGIVLLTLFPGAASAAETLSVRAGEHGDYSRLVIPAAPADWRIATSQRKVEIALPNHDYAFDLSELMGKRRAHRVLSARVVDGAATRSLVVTLTCDCAVRTARSAEGSLVIDIAEGAPAPLAPTDAMRKTAAQSAPAQPEAAKTSTPENMRAARDRMIALLAEARHQGVVQLKSDEVEDAPESETPAVQPAVEPTQIAHKTPEFDPAPTHDAPLAHEARLDPPQLTALADVPADAACVDPSLFDEPLSEEGKLDYSTISKLRARFETSENESERRDLAGTLALAYIHIGFFEEARAIAAPRGAAGDANMAVASALAGLAIGDQRKARKEIAPHRSCGAFFEMIAAAAAPVDDDAAPNLAHAHVNALKALTRPLRGPIGETLALKALEKQEGGIAYAFFDVAREARGSERTAALSILEKALGVAPAETTEAVDAHIAMTAQTPGPMQAKALALLAQEYEEQAEAAYAGLLDDLAQQASNRELSVSEARASFSGARALAAAGRLDEGVRVLNAAAKAQPRAAAAAQSAARSMIISALAGDANERIASINAFFQHRDFLRGDGAAEVNVAVARALSELGAMRLVEDALADLPDAWRAQGDLILAQSALNANDISAALDAVAHLGEHEDGAAIAIKAHERRRDIANAIASVENAVARGNADEAVTRAAWRNRNWPLAIEAFDAAPASERSHGAAARISLAALNAGMKSLPAAARETLAADPDMLAAIAHMFAAAPAVNLRAIDVLADYSTGVAKETNFMQKGLGDE